MPSISWNECTEPDCPCHRTNTWNRDWGSWTIETLANQSLVDACVERGVSRPLASCAAERTVGDALVARLEAECVEFAVAACPWRIAREIVHAYRGETEGPEGVVPGHVIVWMPRTTRRVPLRRSPSRLEGPRRNSRFG